MSWDFNVPSCGLPVRRLACGRHGLGLMSCGHSGPWHIMGLVYEDLGHDRSGPWCDIMGSWHDIIWLGCKEVGPHFGCVGGAGPWQAGLWLEPFSDAPLPVAFPGPSAESELAKLQRQFRLLEGDRRAYAQESQETIRRQLYVPLGGRGPVPYLQDQVHRTYTCTHTLCLPYAGQHRYTPP